MEDRVSMQYEDPPGRDYEKEIGHLALPLKTRRDRAGFDWSFLNPKYTDAASWRAEILPRVMELLKWEQSSFNPQPEWGRTEDKGNYLRCELTFSTQPGTRIPAVLLRPKEASRRHPVPGIVALHCMGGLHVWGKDKIISSEYDNHPVIKKYREGGYGGKALGDQFAERGYAVLAIDSVLFGERMALPGAKIQDILKRRASMSVEEVENLNTRGGGQHPRDLLNVHCRTLGTSPSSWIIHDDIRTVEFLASLPEVDAEHVFCTGLSYGGYRTNWLTALCDKIRAGAAVGWCSTHWHMLGWNVRAINYFGDIPGLWPHMDYADLAGLAVPRPFLSIVGEDDAMFPREGKEAFHDRLRKIYAKASVPEHFGGEIWPGGHQYTPDMVRRVHEFFRRFS